MIRLVYLSTAVRDMGEEELEQMLEQARKNNEPLGITGLLILKGRTFIQCLEGGEKEVWELFYKIEKDDRHKDVRVLEDDDVSERLFPDWQMGFKNVQNLTSIESEKLKDYSFEKLEELPKLFRKFVEIF